MITTWVPGATRDLVRVMMASSESQTTAGTGQAAAVAPRSQPRFGGAYQITWSAWATDSGRPSRCAPSFMELERGSMMVTIGRSEERRVGKECRSRWSPDDEK